MKLTTLKIDNHLRIPHLHLNLDAPVALIAGANEAGKTSFVDSIKYAITRTAPRGVQQKDLKHIVFDGAETGEIHLKFGDGRESRVELPSGKLTGSSKAPPEYDRIKTALPHCLDINKSPDKALILAIHGAGIDGYTVESRLVDRGIQQAKIDKIAPMLRVGFPEAQAFAEAEAKAARAAWKAVTKETYGEKKAAHWTAPKPEQVPAPADIEAMQAAVAEATAQHDEANKRHGEMLAENKSNQEQIARAIAHRTNAGLLERRKHKLAADEASLHEFEQKLAAIRHAGNDPDSIDIHRQWIMLVDLDPTYFATQTALVSRTRAKVTATFDAAKVAECEKAIALYKNAVAASRRDVAESEIAAAVVETKLPDLHDLSEQNGVVIAARTKRDEAQKALQAMRDMLAQAQRADAATAEAASHHADVIEWGKCAEALSPEGIQSELMAAALKPINERLLQTHQATGWDQVSIDNSMTIRIGQRLHALCSQSARYRANLAIAEAISFVSGLRFLIADEFDVLDTNNRLAGLKWLHKIAQAGEIDTAVVAGTFKEPPKVPSTIHVVWMADGRTNQLREAA